MIENIKADKTSKNSMQFYSVTDQSKVQHKVLIISLNQTEMTRIIGQCEICLPSIAVSSMMYKGHPYLIVDFGAETWKTAIPLDERSQNGNPIGDELIVGDVLSVILTSDSAGIEISGNKTYLNIPTQSTIAFSILFDAEKAQIYQLHKMLFNSKVNS